VLSDHRLDPEEEVFLQKIRASQEIKLEIERSSEELIEGAVLDNR
jgi:hypothetical protein